MEVESPKTGLFGKKKKAKKAPEPEATPEIDPLKSAFMDMDEPDQTPRSRKRAGFYFVMFLFLLALIFYMFGGLISGMVPALEPYLSGYISMVDSLRAATQRLLMGG